MNPRRLVVFLLLALSVAVSASAQKRVLTPADLWTIKRLGSPQLSPDARLIVFTQQEWSLEKNSSSTNLWLVEVATGRVRRLTTAQASDGSPAWSPDGSRLAFVSRRGGDEAAALYVIAVDGGEAEKVLELPASVAAPKWLPDGRRLVATTTVIPELAGKMAASDPAAMKKELKRRRDSKVTAKVTGRAARRR